MPHFTYRVPKSAQLCQGDLLEATDELKEVFEKYHPYFTREQYQYFIVLTQTCDLVLRGGKCKSKYITIASVRSFSDYIIRATEQYTEKYGELILLDENNKFAVKQLLERILNNNEQEHFFLAEDSEQEFYSPMVADLKVSIALKSSEHYEACLSAKRLELRDEFKAKLGWLVGQMYSKVGTPDWQSEKLEEVLNNRIEDTFKTFFLVAKRAQINQLKNFIKMGNIDPNDSSAIANAMESYVPETNLSQLMKALGVLCDNNPKLFSSQESKEEFKRLLNSNMKIKKFVKPD